MPECCGNQEDSKSLCYPVHIDQEDQEDDEIYKYTQHTCLPVARSDFGCHDLVWGHKREQFNALTPFLDLSAVYGSGPDFIEKLRNKKFEKGYGLLMENERKSQLFNLPTQ